MTDVKDNGMVTTVEEITPEKARQMLSDNAHNRQVRARVVDRYAHQMKTGKWKLTGETIIFDEDGKLLDGQHRLRGVIQANKPVMFNVTRHAKHETFDVLDSGVKRNNKDVLFLSGFNYPHQYSALVTSLLEWERGIFWHKGASVKKPTAPDVLKYALKNKRDLAETINLSHQYQSAVRGMIQFSVFTTCLHLFRQIDEQDGMSFFNLLLRHDDMPGESPLRILKEKLIKEKNTQLKYPLRMKTKLIMKTWNLWRAKKVVKNIDENLLVEEPLKLE